MINYIKHTFRSPVSLPININYTAECTNLNIRYYRNIMARFPKPLNINHTLRSPININYTTECTKLVKTFSKVIFYRKSSSNDSSEYPLNLLHKICL